MAMPEAFKLGSRKYYEDRGQYRNPYVVGTAEYNDFERGWTQALKRDDGKVAADGQRQLDAAAERQRERAAADTAVAAERYRSRKG